MMITTHFLEVWRDYKDDAIWSERQFSNLMEFKNEYENTFAFMGSTATVFVGTSDDSITRKEALKVATDHVKNNCITIKVDLSLCGTLPPKLQKNSPLPPATNRGVENDG